jgi:uridine kinase
LIPRFDFKQGKRVGYVHIDPSDDDLFIFEGIQAIYPVFTDLINGIPCLSLMISVEEGLTVGDVTLSPRTVRLMRRLVRDYRFRGADPEFSFLLWEGVKANEDKNILPFTDRAELRINSLLGYEACMLKPYLDPLMKRVAEGNSKYREKAIELLRALEGIDVISADYLPENALYREFI